VSENLTKSISVTNPTEDSTSLQEDSKTVQKTIKDMEVPTTTQAPDEGLRLSKRNKKPRQPKVKIFYGERQLYCR
jgi:hypothetical protein